MSESVILIGGPGAGTVMAISGKHPYVFVAEKPELDFAKYVESPDLKVPELKTHRYRIIALTRSILVGILDTPETGSVDDILKELLICYVEHHKQKPPPDAGQFALGLLRGVEMMAAATAARVNEPSDN